eukprot:m.139618 g.139618  ORF g.139618 m.139618 type:complete len:242 (+) comp14802_c0_seq1:1228-1953(+)
MCASVTERDMYTYYFLTKHPGRTLVFVNSIDCIRRLLSLLQLLGIPAHALHANMQQRQRLKNLTRFKERDVCVLIATDVAARGLDIQGIHHVIHYQLPRDVETYIHRSGRTARALHEGLAIVMVTPEEIRNYRLIINKLNDGEDLDKFPIDTTVEKGIHGRLALAIEIDKIENKTRKTKAKNNWFQKQAEEMDIELDDDLIDTSEDGAERKEQEKKVKRLRAQLKGLLEQKLEGNKRRRTK